MDVKLSHTGLMVRLNMYPRLLAVNYRLFSNYYVLHDSPITLLDAGVYFYIIN